MSEPRAEFEGRCPFCRRRFASSSPLALNEALTAHITAEHVAVEDAINWNDHKEN